ncbi:MAG: tetratricopeptide repeat protein [Prevotellaceae bacterium]|jgi:tetratricopeptide (TPR) repeat protein|nr:tetratricopeptide repeat protein [Prevotellaceae bacterium]
MRNILSIFLLFFAALSVFAQNSTKEKFQAANELYKKGQYEQAISVYENLLPANKESVQLYYNLGNAYYKSGQIARAILNYERALLIKPNYENAQMNLKMAQARTVDKIDSVGNFFMLSLINSMSNMMSSNAWAVFSIICFLSAILLFFVYAFLKRIIFRKLGFYGAIAALILFVATFSFSYMQKNKITKGEYAIVMSPSLTAKSTPDETGTKLFVIHEGIKVKVKTTLNTWVEIQLADGNIGWVRTDDIEKI